jgi:hypothetical protein
MSESTARTYIGYATEALQKMPGLVERDKALIYATLAQAEATLEVVDLLRSGIGLRHAEELGNALDHLARRLPDR